MSILFLQGPPCAPKPYQCSKCKIKDVKLWRDYNTFEPDLYCVSCCPGKKYIHTDQIGSRVPAVPSDFGYWGYTTVPPDRCEWWSAQPCAIEVPFLGERKNCSRCAEDKHNEYETCFI
jgi:hypothetical protein